MIRSVKGMATRQFIESGKSKFSGLDEGLARRRLSALNVARKLDDLSRLRSVGLHKLSGDRSGFWAIRVNGPWRIVFRSTMATRWRSRSSTITRGHNNDD
jgi:proteic killer suppression protein